jgi:hypothetical protein
LENIWALDLVSTQWQREKFDPAGNGTPYLQDRNLIIILTELQFSSRPHNMHSGPKIS